MAAIIDLTDKRFGRLLVIGIADRNGRKVIRWHCRCDCGNTTIVRGAHIKSGAIQSCGCLHDEVSGRRFRRHGHNRGPGKISPTYEAWCSMKTRCYNPRSANYKYYGARGISVCDRWDLFDNFLSDMGERPSPDLSLDRINNELGYFPENCRWATRSEQRRNQRRKIWTHIP